MHRGLTEHDACIDMNTRNCYVVVPKKSVTGLRMFAQFLIYSDLEKSRHTCDHMDTHNVVVICGHLDNLQWTCTSMNAQQGSVWTPAK